MSTSRDDLATLRRALQPHERAADEQPWAEERPWRTKTHLWWENDLVVVDLHDLGAQIAREVIRSVLAERPERGGVIFVHGRGKRSAGKTVLRGLLHKELDVARAENPQTSYRLAGSGRTVWISDPDRAPRWAKGHWGPGVIAWWLSLLAAAAVALGHALGLW